VKPDFESTTAMLARRAPGLAWLPSFLHKRFTPAGLWTAVTALGIGIAYVVSAQHDIHRHQESIAVLQANRDKDVELLQKIDTQLAIVNTRLSDITTEVDRQREWRERIEDVAETSPPHRRAKASK
jgi:hypothetical protein